MAFSYSMTPIIGAPSQYSANNHKQIKFPRSLGNNKYDASQQNVLADLVKRGSLHNHKVVSPFSTSLTVRSAGKEEAMAQPAVFETATEPEVFSLDGFELASLTPTKGLKRDDFPSNFLFGASTSALQTEGSGTEGGRGKSTWDFMIEAQKGRKGADSYNLYMEDVKLLKDMGMNTYRFSIAWPRILPMGTEEDGPINQEGIDFYNRLIDALVAEGIKPFVTLHHFDLPVALQNKYRGFLDSQIVEDFRKYADICFKKFGDRVKYWSTINEPYNFGSYGYKRGLHKELQNMPLGPYIATHNIILAHATAAKLYNDEYQRKQMGKIGISLPCMWFEPHSTDPKDKDAANKQLDFMLGWYMDPFVNGDYPKSMKEYVSGLPEFTEKQKEMVRNACDYIGINYYTARYAKQTFTVDAQKGKISIEYLQSLEDINGNIIGEQAQGQDQIYVHPPGLKKLLLYIKEKYNNPELYVTENGVPEKPTITGSVQDMIQQGKFEELKGAFVDDKRIAHAKDHLISIREAIKEGANVKGYLVWSLLDNMEVGAGYDVRFGLNYTDYNDKHKRYLKKSAKWFTNFLAEGPKKHKHRH